VEHLQGEFERMYTLRMDMMAETLLRWMAYHSMPMDDYAKCFADADPENEEEKLIKKTEGLVKTRYEDMRQYHESLIDFFNFVRARVIKTQKADKLITSMFMTHDEITKVDEKIQKIDELRKKVP
jgi:hypothetical protein